MLLRVSKLASFFGEYQIFRNWEVPAFSEVRNKYFYALEYKFPVVFVSLTG
jgi:hypothetical protein